MGGTTIILGNGFDLDLGLKTKYSDFVDGDFWPKDDTSELVNFINQRSDSNWFDLENSLAEYAEGKRQIESYIGQVYSGRSEDFAPFEKLRVALCDHVKDQQDTTSLNMESDAAELLKAISEAKSIDHIFSYNYTDINHFSNQLGVQSIKCTRVHGGCDDYSAILGVSDEVTIPKSIDFLYKTSSKFYSSSNVRYALDRSRQVVFFGHSLGPQDYHYFKSFFSNQCHEKMIESDMKYIIFFTYDDASRADIIRQLRRMNKGRINLLFDCNKILFVLTSSKDKTNLKEAIRQIRTIHF